MDECLDYFQFFAGTKKSIPIYIFNALALAFECILQIPHM